MSFLNPPYNSSSSTLSWWLDSLLLIALIGLLFGSFLGSRALMVPDEGRYAEIAREMVTSGDYVTPQLNNIKYFEKPPFFYWLESAFIKTFEMNEWSLRLLPALFGMIGCLLVYLTTRKLFNRRCGLLAGLILASSALYFTMSHFLTPDIVFTVCFTGSLLAFLLAINESTAWRRNVYFLTMYALAALATLTKGLIGIIFPGMIIFLWLCLMQEWRILKQCCLPTGLLLFLLIAAPWHFMVQSRNPEFFKFYFIDQHFLRYFTSYAERLEPLWFFPVIVVAGFFPWICFLLASLAIQCRKNIQLGWRQSIVKQWRQRQQYREVSFLIIWVVAIVVFFTFSKSLLISYALPVLPPLAMLTALYLCSIWEKASLPELFWIVILTALLLLLFGVIAVVAIHPPYFSYWYITIALLFLSSIFLGLLYFYQKTTPAIVIGLFACISVCLISINLSYETIDTRSTKPLVAVIKPLLPNATLISYHYYYPDLSFYLQRRVAFADFTGELAFGMQHQSPIDWALDKQTFLRRWQSSERIIIITRYQQYDKLKRNYPFLKFYPIAKTPHDVLVMNQPL